MHKQPGLPVLRRSSLTDCLRFQVSQLAPYFDQNITFLEAENMTDDAGWEAKQWAHGGNYFASTVNNVFMCDFSHSPRIFLIFLSFSLSRVPHMSSHFLRNRSRRMFLHAPANA